MAEQPALPLGLPPSVPPGKPTADKPASQQPRPREVLLRFTGRLDGNEICAGVVIDTFTGRVLSVAPVLRKQFYDAASPEAVMGLLRAGLALDHCQMI